MRDDNIQTGRVETPHRREEPGRTGFQIAILRKYFDLVKPFRPLLSTFGQQTAREFPGWELDREPDPQ